MHNSKKAYLIFKRIMFLLFVVFLINYYQVKSGSYIKEEARHAILTEEKIREFESDVKNGEFVDIKDYTEVNTIDSSNKVTDLGYSLGVKIDDFINKKLVNTFKYIAQFFS